MQLRPPQPVQKPPPLAGPGLPGHEEASDRSYGRAVALSATVGFLGAHLFYLGRPLEALADLGLSIGWVWAFAAGHPLVGLALAALDFGHAFLVTILLLTGNFRDGEGRRVVYPGQRLSGEIVR